MSLFKKLIEFAVMLLRIMCSIVPVCVCNFFYYYKGSCRCFFYMNYKNIVILCFLFGILVGIVSMCVYFTTVIVIVVVVASIGVKAFVWLVAAQEEGGFVRELKTYGTVPLLYCSVTIVCAEPGEESQISLVCELVGDELINLLCLFLSKLFFWGVVLFTVLMVINVLAIKYFMEPNQYLKEEVKRHWVTARYQAKLAKQKQHEQLLESVKIAKANQVMYQRIYEIEALRIKQAREQQAKDALIAKAILMTINRLANEPFLFKDVVVLKWGRNRQHFYRPFSKSLRAYYYWYNLSVLKANWRFKRQFYAPYVVTTRRISSWRYYTRSRIHRTAGDIYDVLRLAKRRRSQFFIHFSKPESKVRKLYLGFKRTRCVPLMVSRLRYLSRYKQKLRGRHIRVVTMYVRSRAFSTDNLPIVKISGGFYYKG